MIRKILQVFAIVIILAGAMALPVAAATTHSISGKVTLNAAALKGVKVAILGTTLSATTDGLGNYHIGSVPVGSSGKIVPSFPNYSFTPTNISFTNIQADLTGQNFTATLANHSLYSISGTVTLKGVGLANVKVSIASHTALTNASGAYIITGVPAATTAHLVASLTGYVITPTYILINNLSGNLVNENFTAVATLTISGVVTDAATKLPLGGVTVTLGTLSAVSSATTGAYNIRNILPGTSGVLTPSLAGKTFTPLTYTITNLQTSLHAQSFVAAP